MGCELWLFRRKMTVLIRNRFELSVLIWRRCQNTYSIQSSNNDVSDISMNTIAWNAPPSITTLWMIMWGNCATCLFYVQWIVFCSFHVRIFRAVWLCAGYLLSNMFPILEMKYICVWNHPKLVIINVLQLAKLRAHEISLFGFDFSMF